MEYYKNVVLAVFHMWRSAITTLDGKSPVFLKILVKLETEVFYVFQVYWENKQWGISRILIG